MKIPRTGSKTQYLSRRYPVFPLFAQSVGQRAKKIKGKARYFCSVSDPQTVQRKYLDERDEIQAGRDPGKTVVVGQTDGGGNVQSVS